MAIELLPLLIESGPPEEPPAEYVPPVVTTHQEVAEWASEYLDANNPDLRATSLPLQAVEWAKSIWTAFTAPDGIFRTTAGAITTAVGAVGTVVDATATVLGEFRDEMADAIGWTPATPTVIERLDTIAAGGSNAWWGTIPFDPTNPEWVLVGTDTFTNYIHFEEEGHVYLVDAIAPFASRSEEIVDSESVYFGLGWWSEMADDYRGQRSYLDFGKNIAHRDGHLMRGCLVNFPKGGNGQVSAYKYTPA